MERWTYLNELAEKIEENRKEIKWALEEPIQWRSIRNTPR
jgi:hypothetical protein